MFNPSESSFLAACRGQATPHTPVWFMRQAGRALPEYRAIRGEGSILDAIRKPELAAEITLQPVRRYGVDAAVLYSDIMVPLADSGFGVEVVPGTGPVVQQPFRSAADLQRLITYEPEVHSPHVLETVRILVSELDVPLIGFAGAPFTLAAYLIEGGPSRNFVEVKRLMYQQPETWDALMQHLADVSLASLRAQVNAGASVVQLFDSWVGALSPWDYERYVLPASTRVFSGLQDLGVPRVHFGVGTGELLELMSSAGADVCGVDWHVSLDAARRRVDKPVQGNLDPVACLAGWDVVKPMAERILRDGGRQNHIFNLGHGVLPATDPEVMTRLVDFVHGFTHE